MKYLVLLIKVTIAIILLQTLYFKFTAHPDSVYIFTELGLEPYGRIGIGVMELLAAILLFVKRTEIIAALLSAGLMAGALFSHLTQLGVEVNNDGGLLFGLAVTVMVLSLILLGIRRKEIILLLQKII